MDWNEFLREAIAEKDIDLVRAALAEGADLSYLQDPPFSQTPLFWAVYGGSLEIVRLLLDTGARVAADVKEDSSSLHAAVEDANPAMVSLLLDYDGAEALDWFDYISRTPLMIAVEMENIPIAQRLIEAGADVNAHDEPRIGNTALRIAAENGTLEMVKLLLGAGADPTIRGWMWNTPLDMAEGRKRGDGPRICELLEQAARRF